MNRKFWLDSALSAVKVAVFILACFFIYKVIQNNLTALQAIKIHNKLLFMGTLALAFTTYILVMMGLVCAWLILLRFVEPQRCASIYFQSQIMKYLPGNIFHFAYRHQKTQNANFSHQQLAIAAVHETIVLLVAALLASHFLLFWPEQVNWLTSWLPMPYWPVLLFEVTGIVLALQLLKKSGIFSTLCCYLIYFMGMGWISYLLIFALGFEPQPYLYITACFAASWMAGYVIPGAPGGTGVREVVFILLCTPKMAEHEALIIIALIRLIAIFAETALYFMAAKLSRPYRHFSTWSDKTMP